MNERRAGGQTGGVRRSVNDSQAKGGGGVQERTKVTGTPPLTINKRGVGLNSRMCRQAIMFRYKY